LYSERLLFKSLWPKQNKQLEYPPLAGITALQEIQLETWRAMLSN